MARTVARHVRPKLRSIISAVAPMRAQRTNPPASPRQRNGSRGRWRRARFVPRDARASEPLASHASVPHRSLDGYSAYGQVLLTALVLVVVADLASTAAGGEPLRPRRARPMPTSPSTRR
jgi:hypothetical protein